MEISFLRSWARHRFLSAALIGSTLAIATPGSAVEDPSASGAGGSIAQLWRDAKSGPLVPYLDLRLRHEFANLGQGERHANALTLRARVGVGSRTWRGFSFLVEGEGIVAADTSSYWDATGRPNGRSAIADPVGLELNQATLNWESLRWGTDLRLGRQRIVLEDARFVGNVGWRQNEQTFDAISVRSSFGRPDLELRYAYLWRARRVFGDEGFAPTRDFRMRSHLAALTWKVPERVRVTAFAVLLDIRPLALHSTNSVGLRVEATHPLGDGLDLRMLAGVARQVDAASNPVDFRSHAQWFSVALAAERVGAVEIGVERLGSDAGRAGFSTPLATLHEFNGWADGFLDNGGPAGLRDLWLALRSDRFRPYEMELRWHHFSNDLDGETLGTELDLSLRRQLGPWLSIVGKLAWFDAATSSVAPPSQLRAWLQLELSL